MNKPINKCMSGELIGKVSLERHEDFNFDMRY